MAQAGVHDMEPAGTLKNVHPERLFPADSPLWTRKVQYHDAAFSAHPTHSLAVYKTMAFCVRCVEMQRGATNQKLRRACPASEGRFPCRLTAYKVRSLERLRRGEHPYGAMELFQVCDRRMVREPGPVITPTAHAASLGSVDRPPAAADADEDFVDVAAFSFA